MSDQLGAAGQGQGQQQQQHETGSSSPPHATSGSAPGAIFSSNTDPAAAGPRLAKLLVDPSSSSGPSDNHTQDVGAGRWTLSSHRRGIERPFQFRTFKAAWGFMDAVAAECRAHRHHPEWANVYNLVHIRWTTHKPPGLSTKDLDMAEVCDGLAAKFEEQAVQLQHQQQQESSQVEATASAGETSTPSDVARELSQRIADDGCDACAAGPRPPAKTQHL